MAAAPRGPRCATFGAPEGITAPELPAAPGGRGSRPRVEHPRHSAARSLVASHCRRRAEAMAWTRRAVTRGSGGQLAACYLARTAAVRAENQRAYPIRQV